MLEYLPTSAVILLAALFALLGLVLGSGLNCLALRMSAGQKWSGSERSACPNCHHTLGAMELIPLVSFLLQKGKCRHCGAPISKRYPITEGLLAAVFVGLLLKYGVSFRILTPIIFCCCLFTLSLIDLDTQIIPDRFLVIPMVVRAAELILSGGIRGLGRGVAPGLIIAGAVLVLSLIMDKVLKKDTMGGGDIKLLFVIGMYLSLPQCLFMVMAACIVGIVMGAVALKADSGAAFPFGPALSIATVLTLFFGDPIVGWYLSLF